LRRRPRALPPAREASFTFPCDVVWRSGLACLRREVRAAQKVLNERVGLEHRGGVGGGDGSQSALSPSSPKVPTVKAWKAVGLWAQALTELSADQGFRAGNNSDSGVLNAHNPSCPRRAREL